MVFVSREVPFPATSGWKWHWVRSKNHWIVFINQWRWTMSFSSFLHSHCSYENRAKIKKKAFLNFGTVFLTAVKLCKLRKAHYSPPLVDEDNSMVFTSQSVPFPFLHTSDVKQILILFQIRTTPLRTRATEQWPNRSTLGSRRVWAWPSWPRDWPRHSGSHSNLEGFLNSWDD